MSFESDAGPKPSEPGLPMDRRIDGAAGEPHRQLHAEDPQQTADLVLAAEA